MKKEKKNSKNKVAKRESKDCSRDSHNAYLMLLIFFFICGSIIAISYMARVYLDASSARNLSKLNGYLTQVEDIKVEDYYPIFSFNSK